MGRQIYDTLFSSLGLRFVYFELCFSLFFQHSAITVSTYFLYLENATCILSKCISWHQCFVIYFYAFLEGVGLLVIYNNSITFQCIFAHSWIGSDQPREWLYHWTQYQCSIPAELLYWSHCWLLASVRENMLLFVRLYFRILCLFCKMSVLFTFKQHPVHQPPLSLLLVSLYWPFLVAYWSFLQFLKKVLRKYPPQQ